MDGLEWVTPHPEYVLMIAAHSLSREGASSPSVQFSCWLVAVVGVTVA